MKVIIQENQRGVLTKNGKFVRLLGAGKYHAFCGRSIELLDVGDLAAVNARSVPMSVLEQDADFQAQTVRVDVHDGEYVLHFVDGVFRQLLTTPGHLFFWKEGFQHTFRAVDVTSP